MRDRVCVVTGATRGIGRATATELAQLGARASCSSAATKLDSMRSASRRSRANEQSDACSWVRADFASLRFVRQRGRGDRASLAGDSRARQQRWRELGASRDQRRRPRDDVRGQSSRAVPASRRCSFRRSRAAHRRAS